jgi:nucleotidyltransferase AbiEii toxin of type IV toxin-antitoxin system
MPQCLEPRFEVLPAAQKEIWPRLSPAPRLSFVLYGGTAIALHLGHRQSIDFDFFRAEGLDKQQVRNSFGFIDGATILQDSPNTLVVLASMPSGEVKISFFGGISFGHVREPVPTCDQTLLVASLDDLMATKLKATLDRAEAKDYRDIAKMISADVSLERGLGAFQKMFGGEPSQVMRAIGFFNDGDLCTLPMADREILRNARDRVREIPDVAVTPGSLT